MLGPMPARSTPVAVLIWLGWSLAGIVIGGLGGAMAGSFIGESLGSAEGEGFIGFLYGLWIGPVVGLACGLLAAWLLPGRGARQA